MRQCYSYGDKSNLRDQYESEVNQGIIIDNY